MKTGTLCAQCGKIFFHIPIKAHDGTLFCRRKCITDYDKKKPISPTQGTLPQAKKWADDMVDVCSGKMTLHEVSQEIHRQILKSPDSLVIEIKRRDDIHGYHTTIWVPNKFFEEKC